MVDDSPRNGKGKSYRDKAQPRKQERKENWRQFYHLHLVEGDSIQRLDLERTSC